MGAALLSAICVIGLTLASPVQSARLNRELEKAKAKYERADNPVSRAKAVPKLGREEYAAAKRALKAGNESEALQYLRAYNEQAMKARDELARTVADPEKYSNGFRQLQISVRERTRELKFLSTRVAYDQRKPFDELEKSLNTLNQKLILELFPRRPKKNRKGGGP